MNLDFQRSLSAGYKSNSQIIRVLTESWVNKNIYCPNCGQEPVSRYEDNKPVADFFCRRCQEDYELKSKKGTSVSKIVDGAYKTMLERLGAATNPNFFFLNYDASAYRVNNFFVIPKHYFTPQIIEKRKPLPITARRAGWVGCNILVKNIPLSGRIYFVREGIVRNKRNVLAAWNDTLFLKNTLNPEKKGWLLDVMGCVEAIGSREFVLSDVYAFETALAQKHPKNKHIKDKIRQQLQILRDNGYLEFLGKGNYRLRRSAQEKGHDG